MSSEGFHQGWEDSYVAVFFYCDHSNGNENCGAPGNTGGPGTEGYWTNGFIGEFYFDGVYGILGECGAS